MPPSLQSYDTLASESSLSHDNSPIFSSESQLNREQVTKSTVSSTSDRPSDFRSSRFWTNWKWEFAACLFVLAIPVITFATLYPYNARDQPLPQWPFKISLNSLLSVYSIIFKACIGFVLVSCIGQLQWAWFSEIRLLSDMVYFDSATRGADGAISLIWYQKFRQTLTTLGCIIMVLVIAVDPFIQQLIRPVNCSVEVSGDHATASLPRANLFAGYGYNGYVNRTGSPIPQRRDVEMTEKDIVDILYDAMFSPGQGPPWQCLTGNCTFPTYGTIGFCSSCQDASANVTITANCSDPDPHASGQPTTSTDACSANSNFTLDSNLTAGEYIRLGTKTTLLSVPKRGTSDLEAVPGTMLLANAHSALETGDFNSKRNLLFGFLLGATAGSNGRVDWGPDNPGNSKCNLREPPDASWSCRGYGAALCSLNPCVQTYSASVSAGILEERLIDSSSDTTWGTIYDSRGGLAFLSLIDTYCSSAIHPSSGNRWMPYDYNLSIPFNMNYRDETPLPDEMMSLLESGCLYLISADAIIDVATIYLSGRIEAKGYGTNRSQLADDLAMSLFDFEGPVMMQGMYNWGQTSFERVQSIMGNISDSFTTHIRKHGGTPQIVGSSNFSRDVQGEVYHYATCLQVEWAWLSFPASLAALTILLLLLVVRSTKRQGPGSSMWKASPLAWILRAETPGHEAFPSSHGSCERMKQRSTQIAIHLSDTDKDGREPRIRMADLKDPNLS